MDLIQGKSEKNREQKGVGCWDSRSHEQERESREQEGVGSWDWTKAVEQVRHQLRVQGFVVVKKGIPIETHAKDLYRK